jgi:hypothetical protein
MNLQADTIPVNRNVLASKAAISYCLYFLVLLYLLSWIGIDQSNPNLSGVEMVISYIATWVPYILAIIFVQDRVKKGFEGYISFGKAFSTGLRVAVYTGLFLSIVMILYYKVLDPGAYQKILDAAMEKAGDNDQQRQGIEMMKPYMVFFIGFGTAISYTLFGVLISLAGAAILKNEKPFFFKTEE